MSSFRINLWILLCLYFQEHHNWRGHECHNGLHDHPVTGHSRGHHPEDADLHYQLGVVLHASGRSDDACARMLKVLELDGAHRQSEGEAPDSDVQRDLKERFEAILEEVPEPIMKRLAAAPIHVATAPTKEQVADGLDPRNAVAFVGDAAGGTEEGTLTQIVKDMSKNNKFPPHNSVW